MPKHVREIITALEMVINVYIYITVFGVNTVWLIYCPEHVQHLSSKPFKGIINIPAYGTCQGCSDTLKHFTEREKQYK